MPFVPFANTAEFELRFTKGGEQVENTLYFQRSAAWTSVTLRAVADAVRTYVTSDMMAVLPEDVTFREVYARDLSTEESFDATSPAVGTVVGSAGEAMPNNVTICVTFRSGVTGRSNRGRNYVVGIPHDALLDPNTITGTYASAVISVWNGFIALADDNTSTWVIASRFHNGAPRTVGSTQAVLSVNLYDLKLDSARRRLPGRGT